MVHSLQSVESTATSNDEFYGPEGISVDLEGNMYVTDTRND